MVTGFSDDVSPILLGTRHGRCVRAMTRGFEIRVLEGANVWSIAGSGCESFEGVRCTGFVDVDYPWDLSLGQYTVGVSLHHASRPSRTVSPSLDVLGSTCVLKF